MFEILLFSSLVSWGVNTLLTPTPRPVCYVTEPYGTGKLSTPVWCDEVVKT